MADWILHAHDSEDRCDTKDYSDLMQKIMSYAKDMGCEDLVVFDKDLKEHFESSTFEEESPVLGYIEEFEDNSFWSELTSRLAQRDAMTELKANNLHDIDMEERIKSISNAEKKWSKEFETFGLDRIRTDKTQHDALH